MLRSAARTETWSPPTTPCATQPWEIARCARRFLLSTSKRPVRRSISSTVSTVAMDMWPRSPSIAVCSTASGMESRLSRRCLSREAICTSAPICATTSPTRNGFVM